MAFSFYLGKLLATVAAMALLSAPATHAHSSKADLNGVVATIAPIHSLTQAVMGELGEVQLLVDGNQSPHGFALKPSQRRMLSKSDVVFYVGGGLESFMPSLVAALPENVHTEALIEAEGLTLLPFREGGIWAEHNHDHGEHAHGEHEHGEHEHEEHEHDHDKDKEAHDHSGHDHAAEEKSEGHDHDHDHNKDSDHDHKHDHDEHKGHDHSEHAHDDHADHKDSHDDHDKHDDHDGHAHHGDYDPHIWLDPQNAIQMVKEIEHVLSETYPDHAHDIEHNAEQVVADLAALDAEIQSKLSGASGSFIVFHDAYQYFDTRYKLNAAGSISLDPQESPSAKRVSELRERLQAGDVSCVFKEPQFRGKIIDTIVEGTDTEVSQLDPLGADFPAGATLYPSLLQSMADSFSDCLK